MTTIIAKAYPETIVVSYDSQETDGNLKSNIGTAKVDKLKHFTIGVAGDAAFASADKFA